MILDKRLFENEKTQQLFETLILSRRYFGFENQNKQMEKEIEHILNRSESLELKNGAKKPFLKRIYELELKLLNENDTNVIKTQLENLHKDYLEFLEELPLELLSVKEDLELFTKQVYNRLGYKVENGEYKKSILNERAEVEDAIKEKNLEKLVSQNIGFFQMIDNTVNLKQNTRVRYERPTPQVEKKEEVIREVPQTVKEKRALPDNLEKVIRISERKIKKEEPAISPIVEPIREPVIETPVVEEDLSNTIFDSISPIHSTVDGDMNLDNTISLEAVELESTEETYDDEDTFEMEMYENFSLEEVSSVMYGDSKYWKEIYKTNLDMLNDRVEKKRSGDYTNIEKDSNVFTGLILKVPTSIEK